MRDILVTANRGRSLAVLAVVTPLGFLTQVYNGWGSTWAATHAGGFFYVVFWVFVVLALFPSLARGRVVLGVAMVTSALECAQLWHPAFLERMRSSFLGRAVLGTTFDWSDFFYYAAGALAAYGVARAIAVGGPGSRRPGTA